MSPQPARPLAVLVCGDRHRGDDGAALAAADLLPEALRRRGNLREVGQLDPIHLLDRAYRQILVLDVARGIPPGSLWRGSLEQVAALDGAGPPASTHALPATEVLRLVRQIDGRLPAGGFLAIGGRDFALGAGLSPEVEAGIYHFAAAIAAEIEWSAPATQSIREEVGV